MITHGAVLRMVGIGHRFPAGVVAVESLDLQVSPGEFVAVVGPSGCGKSTLLRLASGLEQPSSGTVEVSTDRLAYVFQDPTLLPWRTVARNVELLAELEGVDRAERRRRAAEAIALVGLEGFERARPRELSGGMRMRASLARSLVLDPELFLFDEPFGALDELTRQRLGDELLGLFTARRFAGLFVTHSVTEAVYLSTRVVVMSPRPGRVIAEIEVPFPHPRTPQLRFDPEFARIAGAVSDTLRESVGLGLRQTG